MVLTFRRRILDRAVGRMARRATKAAEVIVQIREECRIGIGRVSRPFRHRGRSHQFFALAGVSGGCARGTELRVGKGDSLAWFKRGDGKMTDAFVRSTYGGCNPPVVTLCKMVGCTHPTGDQPGPLHSNDAHQCYLTFERGRFRIRMKDGGFHPPYARLARPFRSNDVGRSRRSAELGRLVRAN